MSETDDSAPGRRSRRPLGRGPGAAAPPRAPVPPPPVPPSAGPSDAPTVDHPTPPEEPRAETEPGPEPEPSGAAPPADPDTADPDTADPHPEVAGTGVAATGTTESPDSVTSGAAPGVETVPRARTTARHRDQATGRPVPQPRVAPEQPAEPGTGGEREPGAPGAEDGRFTVVLDNFEGPFDLLLQLIAKHKLDVTEVALSRVTDEFMTYIHAMGPDWDLDQTTEFLVVAATLLDLKAARLLPSAEVEDEADLALLEARDLLFARLLQYRAYKQIADIFADRLAAESRRHPRTVGLEPHHAALLPEVAISIGPEGFARLAVKAMQPKPKPQVYVDHIHAPLVSVREQAEVVIARLRELRSASFRQLVEDAPDTLTVVARFLALLELYRERAVSLEQEEALGTLLVAWSGGGAEPMITDEFDRGPEQPEESGPHRERESA